MSWRSALTPRRLREIWYAPVLLVSMALMLTRLLGYARLLSLESFAGLSLGLLASATLGMTGCLGLQSLLQRDMPVQFVRGRHKAALALLIQSESRLSGSGMAIRAGSATPRAVCGA